MSSFLSGERLLNIPCWLQFDLGSFSYTSRAGFLLYFGSFPYTSHAGFIFLWGVSLTHPTCWFIFLIRGVSFTHPVLASFLSGVFVLHISCWHRFLIWGVFLTHLLLVSFLSGKFLLLILWCLHFYFGSFSYTSRAGFIFIRGVSLTYPMLAFPFCG